MIKPFIAIITAILLTLLIKALAHWRKGEPISPFHLGGMPSAHATGVAALFIAVYFETGPSIFLLICAVFGWLVMRDAFGVRWEVTRHSAALNKLLKTKEYEVVGHTGLEVAVGAFVGLAVAMMIYLL